MPLEPKPPEQIVEAILGVTAQTHGDRSFALEAAEIPGELAQSLRGLQCPQGTSHTGSVAWGGSAGVRGSHQDRAEVDTRVRTLPSHELLDWLGMVTKSLA